ncbi:PorT family protein [Hymenobacter weizhouensis]|uniref:PorT family protein n=1 Tax=Hymenobacter sp. YIM 151500-1 TaxID=2987689 RepID=UPI002226A60D|nr:PorT family protein [Hymenobacter sp. YIM 151500-1]UYZ61761.1 PorT family protein [Hymenobacter sp. YIM 151500-1]
MPISVRALAVVASLLLPGAALGQRPASPPLLLLGLKGGAAVSSGVGPDAHGSSLRLGGHGGALLRVQPLARLAVQAEALYAHRGDGATAYGPSIGHRLSYLNVPVLLQYHPGDLYFEAGPQFSWLLAAAPNTPSQGSLGRTLFQSRAIGFAAGFGYQDTTGLTLGWRYNGNWQNLYRPVELVDHTQVRLRSSAIEFYMSYVFEPRQAGQAGKAVARGSVRAGRFLFVTVPVGAMRAVGRLFRKPPAAPATAPATPAPALPKQP